MFEQGISREGGILDVGVEMNVITKSGAFFRYNEQLIGQGKAAAIDWLKENPEEAKKIVQQIMTKSKDGGMLVAVGVEEDSEDVITPTP